MSSISAPAEWHMAAVRASKGDEDEQSGLPKTLLHRAARPEPHADDRRRGHPHGAGDAVLHEDHRAVAAGADGLGEGVLVEAVDPLVELGAEAHFRPAERHVDQAAEKTPTASS